MATEEVIINVEPIDLSDILPPIAPGYTWSWTFFVLDDNDDPIDTTSWACEIHLKNKANGETKATMSTTGGEITNTPASGQFSVVLPAADTALIDCRQVVFDVKLTDASSNVHRPFVGTVEIAEVITQ